VLALGPALGMESIRRLAANSASRTDH
jgi:hypothetical protein